MLAGDEEGVVYTSQGANTLRGGVRVYSSRTLEGGWTEDRFLPGFSGTRREARTEEAERQAKVTGAKPPAFGSGVIDTLARREAAATSVEGRYDAADPIHPDRLAAPETWKSTTRACFRGSGEEADADLRSTMTPGPGAAHEVVRDKERLRAYRERYLSDKSGAAAAVRFRTEVGESLAQAVEPRFLVSGVRALRGLPKSVDRLRELLVGRHGALAVPVMRRALQAMDENGDGRVSEAELRRALREDHGVVLTVDEFNELWRELDQDESGFVDRAELLRVLRVPGRAVAETEGFDGTLPRKRASLLRFAYQDLCDRVGRDGLSFEEAEKESSADSLADVKAGRVSAEDALTLLLDELPQEDVERREISQDGFVQMHASISAAVPGDEDFARIIQQLWRLDLGDLDPAGATEPRPAITVLATHADGSKSLQRVRLGPFTKVDDPPSLMRQLRRKGVDVVDVSTDF